MRPTRPGGSPCAQAVPAASTRNTASDVRVSNLRCMSRLLRGGASRIDDSAAVAILGRASPPVAMPIIGMVVIAAARVNDAAAERGYGEHQAEEREPS